MLKDRDRVIFCFLLPCLLACFVVYVLAVGCQVVQGEWEKEMSLMGFMVQ